MQKEAISEAYEDVRNDSTTTTWALLTYDDNSIILDSTGTDYDEFVSKFSDDERQFGFVRILMGDEMSKRAKFALITWIGANVSALKRARVSTDKTAVKAVILSYAVEIQTSDKAELALDYVREALEKAGGASYGTGVRE